MCHLNSCMIATVWWATYGRALSWKMLTPLLNIPLPRFWNARFHCFTVAVSVYCGSSRHKLDQQCPLSIPRHSCHYRYRYTVFVWIFAVWAKRGAALALGIKWNARVSSSVSIESKKLWKWASTLFQDFCISKKIGDLTSGIILVFINKIIINEFIIYYLPFAGVWEFCKYQNLFGRFH